VKVTLLLADHAQAVQNKLYVLGGGWSFTGPGPTVMAIAIKIEVPWSETNRTHELALRLIDEDAHPVSVPGPVGDQEVRIDETPRQAKVGSLCRPRGG
jgi:hypothetical protein